MTRKPAGPLRRGWTTGACATAAARAAFEALLTGRFPDPVEIPLPNGERPRFALARTELDREAAVAGVIKDAGDDPDVTDGALIVASVRRSAAGAGVTFRAGEGVGRITRPGLPLPVGEPAINPAPRDMIRRAIEEVAAAHTVSADAEVTISVPGGAAIAEQTWNPRLGIVGGISILGTTGVVIPYSCSAWIHSIHSGIDVARACGVHHVAGATGKTSEDAVRTYYGLGEDAVIDMGDFAGGMLKYLRTHPVERVTIAGGFAKMVKLAQGHMDLHSSRSRVNIAKLARWLGELGVDEETVRIAARARSAGEVLALAGNVGLGDLVARRGRETALAALAGETALDVLVVDRAGAIIGRAGP